jgi:arabinofuranosyltransferase
VDPGTDPRARHERVAVLATLVLALGLALWHMTRFPVVVDDSYIAFRAAANWAATGVPEYNPGSREWVPTSFLWVALVAAGAKVASSIEVRSTAQLLGGLAGIATILLLVFALPRSRLAGATGALLCASSATFAAWPLSGMDAALFFASVVAGTSALLRLLDAPTRRIAIVAGLAWGVTSLVRPDGLLLSAVAAAAIGVGVRGRATLGWFALAHAFALAPALLYLWATFGTIVPVSYYAKVHGLENVDRGMAYLLGGLRTHHLAWVLPFIAMAFADPRHRRAASVLLTMLMAWAAWVVVDGGDFLPYHRFLSPVWPLIALLCGLGLTATAERVMRWRPRLAFPAAATITLLVLATAAAWTIPTFRGAERDRYEAGRVAEEMREAIGRYFAGKLRPAEWIAVKPAGIIPYYSGARAIDFFCLADRKAARQGDWVQAAWIGHQRMNADRVHEIFPDIVILEARLYPLAAMPPPWQTDPNHGGGWLSHPGAGRYAPVKAEIVPGYWLGFFVKR